MEVLLVLISNAETLSADAELSEVADLRLKLEPEALDLSIAGV